MAIYRRGGRLWWRKTIDGVEYRRSLGTSDMRTARLRVTSLERYYAIADILKHDAVVRAWLRDHFRGDKVGWVYFALVRSARLIKIGFSQAIPSRLATLQTNSAHAVQIIKRIRGTRADERAWHREFEDLRRRGEWFHAAPRLLKAIRTATASRQ